ncbi:MAG: 5-oxoprolinase subunit PxpA [Clostridia bacterium]|nr:5-oxoprolinase subunit PxpA [Clostridia bacterium]
MISIDLNADLGESFGRYTLGMDEKIMEVISSANIACGFHAGDPMVMERTVRLAAEAGIAIGAHPGFPDLMGFGRRNMAVSPEEARAYILYQLGALDAFLRPMGIRMRHVKPHGALYNMAAADEQLARAICGAVKDFDPELRLVGLSGSLLIRAAEKTGLRAISEVFADRSYEADGSLVSRRKPGAIISDEREALRRVIRMVKEGKVKAINGEEIAIRAESVCVHGDGEKALLFAKSIREALTANDIQVSPA